MSSPTSATTDRDDRSEEGSVVTEYGLLAVVVATVAALLIQWASGGALLSLFDDLLTRVRTIVGL